jgi:hypothetical protein
MVIFGYIVYMILTFWVTLITVVVAVNPFGGESHPAEKWFLLVIMGLFWYGAYQWFPFTVGMV